MKEFAHVVKERQCMEREDKRQWKGMTRGSAWKGKTRGSGKGRQEAVEREDKRQWKGKTRGSAWKGKTRGSAWKGKTRGSGKGRQEAVEREDKRQWRVRRQDAVERGGQDKTRLVEEGKGGWLVMERPQAPGSQGNVTVLPCDLKGVCPALLNLPMHQCPSPTLYVLP
ncbi:hypothetical protein Pcinc_017966 [Petrolisthes cinctipes]|uniref:Uncharacterized protein n=1 Tax=Petrolisthes cinctipes TaxID=88211 RepID=A0AAE1KN86_PETCI|nr:hypothetical protein Pcinc_017966 [Petrolisthes cinctipes]